MDEAPKPRLSLSRRRPPPGDGCPPELGPWAGLARVAGAGLDTKGEIPPLPARPGQEPGPPESASTPEVFTVGLETFTWLPFPPAPRPAPAPPQQGRAPPLETPALQSCPLCQAHFSPTLTQLDIDSHLAQCLAAGTEAEGW